MSMVMIMGIMRSKTDLIYLKLYVMRSAGIDFDVKVEIVALQKIS